MRRVLLCALLISALPASAAPVQTGAILTVDLGLFGAAPISVAGFGTVSVTGSTVVVPAGLVSLGTTLIIPITATTAGSIIGPIRVQTLSNLAGTFSVGGVTNQRPGEVCQGAVQPGRACNVGGGVGGVMGITGTAFIFPHLFVVVPINFGSMQIGQGGSTNVPFEIDAALWTTRTASVGLPAGNVTMQGGRAPFSLVTPTYVSALGNLLPIFSTFTLTAVSLPVPEAGAALLVGCAGLAIVIWRRS